jgi:hypothetical protein
MDQGHEPESNQGAEQSQYDNKRQQPDVASEFGLWINHDVAF